MGTLSPGVMKKVIKVFLVFTVLFVGYSAQADTVNVNLIIKDGDTTVFSGTVPLQPAGTIQLNGHSLDADSVLSVINDADALSPDFSISDLQYYGSMGSFYLKCITDSIGNECDNWQYVVDGTYGIALDKTILTGDENVYLYFGQHYKLTLGSNAITSDKNLKVTVDEYNYENNSWAPANGLIIGIIEPNSWPTVEIMTGAIDTNGQVIFSSIPIGSYSVGIKPDYFPTESLTVTAPLPPPASSSSGGGGVIIPKPATKNNLFDTDKAFKFLTDQQKENGTFGEELYTDWSTLALMNTDKYQDAKIKLIKYYSTEKISGTLLTDYERRAMAVMSLGLNPYNVNGENYIEKIVESFDGKQFGDPNENNDDIFALIVLQNAGYNINDKMIADDISFILSTQKPDGSWNESIDMTGAALQSLAFFARENSLLRAKEYLKQNQKSDGGFGNVSSTAWAMQGILALGEKPIDWIKNGNTPLGYLAINQDIDGGIKESDPNSKVWETTYVLSALSDKTWNEVMQKFDPLRSRPRVASATVTLGRPVSKGTKTKKEEFISTTPPTTVISVPDIPLPTKKQNWFNLFLNVIFGF